MELTACEASEARTRDAGMFTDGAVTRDAEQPHDASGDAEAVEDAGAREDAGPVDAGPPFRTELASTEELGALALDTEGLDAVKYVAPIASQPRGVLDADCYFQNMRVYPWHLQFLRSFSSYAQLNYEGYVSLVLRPATRRLWGGAVQRWPDTPHPERAEHGVISYTVYAEAGTLELADVIEVDGRLKGCMPFAGAELVYVPENPAQEALVAREAAALRAAGVIALDPDALQ